jgi:hypothetical protein
VGAEAAAAVEATENRNSASQPKTANIREPFISR